MFIIFKIFVVFLIHLLFAEIKIILLGGKFSIQLFSNLKKKHKDDREKLEYPQPDILVTNNCE